MCIIMRYMKPKTQRDLEDSETILDCDPKFIRSLMRSGVRKSTLLHLHKIYPQASYPAEIARRIEAHPMSVIGALRGASTRYNASSSLLTLGVVSTIENDGAIFYKLSEMGMKIAESLIITRK